MSVEIDIRDGGVYVNKGRGGISRNKKGEAGVGKESRVHFSLGGALPVFLCFKSYAWLI